MFDGNALVLGMGADFSIRHALLTCSICFFLKHATIWYRAMAESFGLCGFEMCCGD